MYIPDSFLHYPSLSLKEVWVRTIPYNTHTNGVEEIQASCPSALGAIEARWGLASFCLNSACRKGCVQASFYDPSLDPPATKEQKSRHWSQPSMLHISVHSTLEQKEDLKFQPGLRSKILSLGEKSRGKKMGGERIKPKNLEKEGEELKKPRLGIELYRASSDGFLSTGSAHHTCFPHVTDYNLSLEPSMHCQRRCCYLIMICSCDALWWFAQE